MGNDTQTDDTMQAGIARSLPAFSLRRPITAVMAVVSCVGLGAVCWMRLPIDFMIDISQPALRVMIPYPGANPEQVEQEVAIPAEGVLKTVPGLERISTSSNAGGCYIWMEFERGADISLASAETRDRMERLKLVLPREIEIISMRRFSAEAVPIMRFALFRQERTDELAQYARTKLKNRLLRTEGVAEVRVEGSSEEYVFVDFDQDALSNHQLSVYQVIEALQRDNIDIGIGEITDGLRTFYVRARDEYATGEDLARAIISPMGLRLQDVAKVTTHPPSGADTFRIDGKGGVFFEIVKEAEANVVETCARIHEELDRIKLEPEFRNAEILIFEDQSELIRFALSGLYQSGEYGALLAVIVLWFFLRRVGPTLIVAAAIPTSLLVAPVYIFFTGRSLNLITIGAMLISVGMLVDNAIVVVENIHRLRGDGVPPRRAILHGTVEVGVAIAGSTITTLIVFVPVIFLPAGELSTIMREFAGPITCILTASLVVAVTIVPVLEMFAERLTGAWRALRCNPEGDRPPAEPGRWRRFRDGMRRVTAPMQWVEAYYLEGLRATVGRRHVAAGVLAALLATTYFVPYRETGFRGFPDMDSRHVRVWFEADPNYGQDPAVQTVQGLVDLIEPRREELGIRNIYVNSGAWGGYIDLFLKKEKDLAPGQTLPCTTEQVRQRVNDLLPPRVPGGRMDCGISSIVPEEGREIRLRFRGDDTRTLDRLAEGFMRIMKSLPELTNVKSGMPASEDEIQLQVDEERAAAAGLTPLTVARSVDFALRGANLPRLKRDGREILVRGQLEGADRSNRGDLESMMMPSTEGKAVTLSQLVTMQKGLTKPNVYRSNAKSYTELRGRATEENLIPVRAALTRLIENFDTPRGCSIELDENLVQIDELLHSFRVTIAMSVVLIYLVMAALFESWLLPFSVLATVPLAYVGVYWVLYLTGTPLDTLSLVGSVILCGVIVNNGIVIIDHINQLRIAGMDRHTAIMSGGLHRLRPVLMTTLTTILGVLPVALDSGSSNGALNGLGRALVGGLTVGTGLTLFIVPMVYTVVDDISVWVRDYFRSMARLSRTS